MTFRLSRYSNINGNNFIFSWSYLVKDTMEIFYKSLSKISGIVAHGLVIRKRKLNLCWKKTSQFDLKAAESEIVRVFVAPFQSWMHFKSVYFCPNCPEEEELQQPSGAKLGEENNLAHFIFLVLIFLFLIALWQKCLP